QTAITSSPTAFDSSGGMGQVAVSTARDCTWSLATDANWIAFATVEGQGTASVPYTVAPNPVPSQRSGSISAGGARIQLSQRPEPCQFHLNSTRQSISALGGQLAID